MERHKISKLLNNLTISKFVTKKWIEVNDLSGDQYSFNKSITFKAPVLRSDLCDYSHAYIFVKGVIDLLAAANENDEAEKDNTFKNNAPFRFCILKINNTLIDKAEDVDVLMPMYNLLEYSDNYSIISRSLWNYYRDKIDGADVGDNASDGKSIVETLERPAQPGNPGDADKLAQPPAPSLIVEVTFLKYLSNFWRSHDLFLMNCEVEHDFFVGKDSVLIKHHNNIT